MNKKLLAALLPLLVVGCTATPAKTALQAQSISTDGASKVAFHQVRVEGSTLKGSLGRIGRNPVYFGHLDYTIADNSGQVLQRGQTSYSGAIKQRLPRQDSRFSIPLQQVWQPGEHRASIVWHDQPHQP